MKRVAFLLAAAALMACAKIPKPDALVRAEILYDSLQTSGANDRAEGDLIRAREALTTAQIAHTEQNADEYLQGTAQIALRMTQAADARNAKLLAEQKTDSLQKARLRRLLTMSEAQRAALAQQQALSAVEIATLEQRNRAVQQTADSLRRANEAANAALEQALQQLRSLVTEITNLRETTRGLVISLSDILFDINKASLKPGASANVGRIATILRQYPDKQIVVEGHTDATGSDSYNQKLSEDRAASVREALVAGGVDASKITSQGFGESTPVASNDNAAGRQQNRRVEIIVLGAGKLADAMQPAASDTARTPPR